jgi:hypothetical protein
MRRGSDVRNRSGCRSNCAVWPTRGILCTRDLDHLSAALRPSGEGPRSCSASAPEYGHESANPRDGVAVCVVMDSVDCDLSGNDLWLSTRVGEPGVGSR